MSANQDDKVFLNERGIMVTQTFFVVHGETFKLADISAVEARHFPRSRVIPFALLGFGGILSYLIWSGIGMRTNSGQPGQFSWSYMLIALGLLMMAAGVFLLLRKGSCAIVLSTGGGEIKTCQTEDKDFAGRIATALNEAIGAPDKARAS